MLCKKCFTENSETAKFCENCGSPLLREEAVTGDNGSNTFGKVTTDASGTFSVEKEIDKAIEVQKDFEKQQGGESTAQQAYTEGMGNTGSRFSQNAQNVYGNGNMPPVYPVEKKDDGNSFAVASLICSIISFFCCGLILAPLGIIFGFIAKRKGSESGMATAGIVIGIIAVAIVIISFIIAIVNAGTIATNAITYNSFEAAPFISY